MKQKISTALAASLIVGQMQGVAFAENTTNLQDVDVTNENLSQSTESITDISIIDQTEEATEKHRTEDEKKEASAELGMDTSNAGEVEEKEVSTEPVLDTSNTGEVEETEQEKVNTTTYKRTGKLELDLNFSMPIKYTNKEETSISVKLKDTNGDLETIKLGSDTNTGTTQNGISYSLEALNSKREVLKNDETDLSFYHLTFENLDLGDYSLEISGDGYISTIIENIDVTKYSKRVLVGTSENTIVIDDKGTEDKNDDHQVYYPGVFLAGNIDAKDSVTKEDYDELKAQIKSKSSSVVKSDTKKFDLNRDGKIDITDLTYVHKNMDKKINAHEVVDTDPIIDPDNVNIELSPTTVPDSNVDITDLLKDNGSTVPFKNVTNDPITEDHPISMEFNLSGITNQPISVEQVVIKSPSENAPISGSVVIPGGGENGESLSIPFDESNIRKLSQSTRDGNSTEELVIDLGKQVAVSKITINVTGIRSNKNLAEIAKVDFLNNVYKEVPEPKMNVPVINNFTSSTAVGNEAMAFSWNHETNVTGYEIKVEEVDEKGTVISTNTYKTNENTLKIEGINGYSVYRVSIQSLSGDWKSGYKDEQDNYQSEANGDTNLLTNSNDKDGVPDNVDTDYNPKAWNSSTGKLEDKADGTNGNNYGSDSIIELQVVPETAPEGPEGIKMEGQYKRLNVSWKSHKKAKDYDLYYRAVNGDGAWIKANDPNEPKYVDTDKDNNIPDGVTDLTPEQKEDKDELIRDTSYTITGLEDKTTYEIKMTATNHHGTGGLSQTFLGTTADLTPPVIPNYKLINTHNEKGQLTNHIEKIELKGGQEISEGTGEEMFDNDYSTSFIRKDWCAGVNYDREMPRVTFDQEYTIDTIRFAVNLENPNLYTLPHRAKLDVYDESGKRIKEVKSKTVNHIKSENGVSYVQVKLSEPVTAQTVSLKADVYGGKYVSISELKFYHYDSLENDVDALFKDELMLELSDDVTQEKIDELIKRANTIDPVNLEYHPNQTQLLSDLQRAQDLLVDVKLSDRIIELDSEIRNTGKTIGQSNNYQALGVAVKPGDKVNIYIGSANKNTKFKLAITQHYAESGTAVQYYDQKLTVGKNEITIPESAFDMDYEKGGNLYLNFDSSYNDNQAVSVRVSGGTEIPHLNLNNVIDDESKEQEAKDAIRTYIKQLKTYVNTLPERYPSSEDKSNNIYKYDPTTSILNSTEIEGDRITLSLAANQVLKGITDGLSSEEQQVNRLYDTLRAWEQLMKVSYAQQGLLESAVDFDGDGQITKNAIAELNGKTEQQFFNENKAPSNRINIKYQRMFTGAFMYAGSHHVGIGYGSVPDMMKGVPFKFDENGNLVNKDEASLFGWGINHEIGHVHDISGLTYTEVTNNILALMTQTFDEEDESRFEMSKGAYEDIYKKVTSGSVGLASSGLTKLGMFWQLHLAYDQDHTYKMLDINSDNSLENDTFYAKLYRVTREKGIAVNETGHDRTAQTFIMRSSDAVGKDLRDFFAKWGIVASPKTNEYLDSQNYPKEDKAIYYLNDHARRIRLEAKQNNNQSSLVMAKDVKVNASFGLNKDGNQITNKTYLNQKEIPLKLSVDKDQDKILGYEIIKLEATSQGVKEAVSGFVERNSEGKITEYVDVVDTVNNRTFGYKVRAYDYDLNVTEETEIGTVKVSHDGSIAKSDWKFDTNTRSAEDVADEHTGHGHVENGSINKIKDNNKSTVYNASKATDHNGQTVKGDPYVTIEMDGIKSVVGLKYSSGTTAKKKFSFKNLFSKNKEVTYSPISEYEVLVSENGTNWTKVHSGKFDTTTDNTIYFNEKGNNDNSQLWSYNAKYVKLVAKNASTISIAELDILGPQGDNIEIGMDNNDQNFTNGVGKLKSDYEYAKGEVIPKGSILVMGEYKGDPAFNVPLVVNENNENFALKAQAVLLANLPEDAELGEVAEGNWIYWITPEQQAEAGNIEGKQVKAELYRYNKLDADGAPIGQRLVSDTFLVDIDITNLPTLDLSSSKARGLKSSYDKVVKLDSKTLQRAMKNR